MKVSHDDGVASNVESCTRSTLDVETFGGEIFIGQDLDLGYVQNYWNQLDGVPALGSLNLIKDIAYLFDQPPITIVDSGNVSLNRHGFVVNYAQFVNPHSSCCKSAGAKSK